LRSFSLFLTLSRQSSAPTDISPKLKEAMRQHSSAVLVCLSVEPLEVKVLLDVSDDLANVELEELI
jgi:hypothetical protein